MYCKLHNVQKVLIIFEYAHLAIWLKDILTVIILEEVVRLGGETSNSFLDVLEDWDTYLQAEKIDLDNLSQSNAIEVLLEANANKAAVKTLTSSRVNSGIKRLEP